MEPNPLNNLTDSQHMICRDVQQFLICTSKQLENRLVSYHWMDYIVVIRCQAINDKIRLACISAMKSLVYNKNFIQSPQEIFTELLNLYMKNQNNSSLTSKIQGASQIIIETIVSSYFKEIEKWETCRRICEKLWEDPSQSIKLLKILMIMVNNIQVETINNEVIIGQALVFIQHLFRSDIVQDLKILSISEGLKIIDEVLELIDDYDLQQAQNQAQIFLRSYAKGRQLLFEIIESGYGENQKTIISNHRQLDKVKFQAISLYKRIWAYGPDEKLFHLCAQTLMNSKNLIDEQIQIMNCILKILERSLGSSKYFQYFFLNTQNIVVSLLDLLKPEQSMLEMVKSDPEFFIQIQQDFCLEQNQDFMQTAAGSLLSNLCLSVDGYLTFVSSLCLMVLKKWDNSIEELQGGKQYFSTIENIWPSDFITKLGTGVLLLAALSDQIQKRPDLYNPLMANLHTLNPLFKIQQCTLHPYIICRFMTLYSFYSYRSCLDIFLPYKTSLPVYDLELQSCYSIMRRYANRRKGVGDYIKQIAPYIVLSDHLTPTLQNVIFTSSQMHPSIQFAILEKLALWMQESYEKQNTIVCNKVSNLIVHLIDKFNVSNEEQTLFEEEKCVYQYLESSYRMLINRQGNPLEQSVIEIMKSHFSKFVTIIPTNFQRMIYFFQAGCIITERNQCTMNSCAQLLAQLTMVLPYQPVINLIQKTMSWITQQDRQEDKWECLYLIEICLLRIDELGGNIPNINLEIIIELANQSKSKILYTQVYMILYCIISIEPASQTNLQIYLSNKSLPPKVLCLQNKAFCLYLMNLLKFIEYTPENICSILEEIFKCFQIEENLAIKSKKEEEQIFAFSFDSDEVAMNAFTKLKVINHPLRVRKINLYDQFRKFWANYKYRESFKNGFNIELQKTIQQVLKKVMVGNKPRQYLKIKRD